MAWKLYLLEPTDYAVRTFRRFTFASQIPCPGRQYGHDATVFIDMKAPYPVDVVGYVGIGCLPDDALKQDSRWPKKCDFCDYVFLPEDQWQDNWMRLFKGAPDGREYVLRDKMLPPGACWWTDEPSLHPDGKNVRIRLPNGEDFMCDWPYGQHKWKRTGSPPLFELSPSINCVGEYHGFVQIRNGVTVVTDDCEGRTFPHFPATA